MDLLSPRPEISSEVPESSDTKSNIGLRWCLLGLAALALLGLGWWLRSGRGLGTEEWLLKSNPPWPVGAWGLPLTALVVFGGLCVACLYDRFYRAKSAREQSTSLKIALGALMLLSMGWNWGLLGPYGLNAQTQPRTGFFNVLASAYSDVSTEYFGTAYQIQNAREFARDYPSQQTPRSTAIAHVATHPPGATLFYFGVRRAVEGIAPLREALLGLAERGTELPRAQLSDELNAMRSRAAVAHGASAPPLPPEAVAGAVLALALLGAAPALAVSALFVLASMGSKGSHDEPSVRRSQGRGVLACALWILAPTVGLFAPTLDALVALGAVWTLALASKYLEAPHENQNGHRKYLVGAGMVLAFTGAISFGALTMGLVTVLWLALERRFTAIAWLLAGAVAGQLLVLLAFPHPLHQVFARAMEAHEFATLKSRSYALWLRMNPVIFALFVGWPVVLGVVAALLSRRNEDTGRSHLRMLGAATMGAMLLISLAGSVRGEVERLWMFLLPPFCALAASWWLPLEGEARRNKIALAGIVALGAVVLQAAQSLFMAATLAPLVRPL